MLPPPGYIATPAGDGPWPGVVVLHELFGLSEDIHRAADRVAAMGFVAFAPDLFHHGSTVRCILACFRALHSGRGRAFDDIDASREELLRRSDCTGRVGIVGFCMGGGFALMTAPRGFDAAAANYGVLPSDPDAALRGACPIVASYGGKDFGLRGAAGKLESSLTRIGVEHDVKEYPQASHSFLNHHPGWTAVIDKVTGFGYEPESAADAWARTEAFLHAHLDGAQPNAG